MFDAGLGGLLAAAVVPAAVALGVEWLAKPRLGDGHRTPFEILDGFRWTGDLADLALWHEYERASRGHQAITWSKGLRKLLAAPARTDEELAAEEVGGDIVTLIEASAWRAITVVPGLPGYLLDEAERGGASAVRAVLAGYGIEAGPAPP
jgi:hypothetical protein